VECQGIRSHWIETSAPTRVCTTVLDVGRSGVTELVENAPAIAPSELEAFQQAYFNAVKRAELVVLTGSLPSGAPAGYYRELLAGTPCPAILDFRGPELWESLAYRPLLVKPNREELGHTVGRALQNETDLLAAVDELHERGARWVAITDGARPLLVSGPKTRMLVSPPQVEVVNPIAAGDCLAAGIAWGIVGGTSIERALKLGVAAASANVEQLLPARLVAAEIQQRADIVQARHL
jgi:fructose-1-phosphate kinase PfkB-like protein